MLTNADVGAAMTVRVSYTDLDGTSEQVTSAATSAVVNVNDTPVGLPSISRHRDEGQTLS